MYQSNYAQLKIMYITIMLQKQNHVICIMYSTMHKKSSTCMCVGLSSGEGVNYIRVHVCNSYLHPSDAAAQSKQSYSIADNANTHAAASANHNI